MANENFLQLPTVANATLSDVIAAVQGNVTVQETLQQIFNLVISETILFNAGDPNGVLAGSTYQLCWDTTNKIFYICTTSGSSTTALWTNIVSSALIAGTNISLSTTSAGTVIDSVGATGIVWTNVTGTSINMVAENGYLANNSGLVSLTLPVTAAFGTIIYVTGFGAGGWTVLQNSGQQINIGSSATTIGVGGSISSSDPFDSVALLCTVANTNWVALTGVQGIITVV